MAYAFDAVNANAFGHVSADAFAARGTIDERWI
jgi:hypothetical protein